MEQDEDEVMGDAPPESASESPKPKEEPDDNAKPVADTNNSTTQVQLADLFNDDDDDDEFPGSSAIEAKVESPPPKIEPYVPEPILRQRGIS